jgi:hypothetical protein
LFAAQTAEKPLFGLFGHGELVFVLELEEGFVAVQHGSFCCGEHSCCDCEIGTGENMSYPGATDFRRHFESAASPVTVTTAESIDTLRSKLGSFYSWMLGIGKPDEACRAIGQSIVDFNEIEKSIIFTRWVFQGGTMLRNEVHSVDDKDDDQ